MRKVVVSIIFLIILNYFKCNAQLTSVDSLLKIFSNTSLSDTLRLNAIDQLAWDISADNADSAILFAEMEYEFALSKSNLKFQALSLSTIGASYNNLSNYLKALEAYYKVLKLYEFSKDIRGTAVSLSNIGSVYIYLFQNEKALEYCKLALKKQEEIIQANGAKGNKQIQGTCFSNIGVIYTKLDKTQLALEYIFKALKIKEELDDKIGILECYVNLGVAYEAAGDPKNALIYFLKDLQLARELNYKKGLGNAYNNIADIYRADSNSKLALLYLDSSMLIANEIENISQISLNHLRYSMIYETIGNYKAAYKNHVLYKEFNDSIFNIENSKQLGDLKTNFAVEKKTLELTTIATAERKKQQLIIAFIAIGLLFVGVFALFIFRSLKVTRKQKDIIETKGKETEFQKQIVEQKNKEITQSITYALRIQTAILPPHKTVQKHLTNSFILYKPKDIVAGDFYWMETIELADVPISQLADEKNQFINTSANQLILFAACDCTGHGVPGAMVSVVCHNALNRAVKEFGLTQPAAILDKTTQIVVENFSKSEEDIKDGMDISLCALNTKTRELQWAGANNPLWIVKRMDNEKLTIDNEKASKFPLSSVNYQLLETKADKQPIGMNDNHHPFTNQTFTLGSGDTIYIFTDGFADQFGGQKGEKKLTRKRFKEQLLAIQDLSMLEQGIALDKFIVDYQKEVPQVDDILVMGVRV